jgi:hypothetical protein
MGMLTIFILIIILFDEAFKNGVAVNFWSCFGTKLNHSSTEFCNSVESHTLVNYLTC